MRLQRQKEKGRKTAAMELLLRLVVKDEKGQVIQDTGQMPSKSYVLAFLRYIYCLFDNPGNYLQKATNGTNLYIYYTTQDGEDHCRADAPTANDDYGIVVGTGTTAVDNIDHKLDTQLTEGAGAGNISHGAMVVGSAGVVGANVDLVLNRAFTNNTGSTIAVAEAGVYIARAASWYHCIIRDVLPSPVNVPDKCSLTVYYTLRTTV